ncbi:uncharacterized protein KIAA2013 homolog isoform X2 [Periplaneta americana]|uniref:uncharacterized protein KIAA2013 homolog isoform X2 n=1 Tax=Periplaneta americana TaxID=6978 RepID=UPI0037E90E43
MDCLEMVRKWKRNMDNYFTYRRTFLLITIVFGLILYIGPSLLRWLSQSNISVEDIAERCLSDRLRAFYSGAEDFNANMQHIPLRSYEKPYIPYVGNGVFGIHIHSKSPMYIRNGRILSLPVYYHPVINVGSALGSGKPHEATVVHYLSGIVHRYQCYSSGLYVSYQYYAHRTLPAVLVQDITITNPTNEHFNVEISQMTVSDWPTAVAQVFSFEHDAGENYHIYTGLVNIPSTSELVAVSVMSKNIPHMLEVKARSSVNLQLLTAINYSDPISQAEYATWKDVVEKQAMDHMRRALAKVNRRNFKEDHMNVWAQLWSTGITISYSKAADAINGDKINATMYYILSQVSSPYHEETTTKQKKTELANSLSYAEGCFGGYHTLQAANLWRELSTIDDVNTAVSLWLLTLEKQGCHNLLKAGASGVVQAMVLSFGALRFSNQHLEFNIHPKYLHRDYLFRRLNYGNLTHVNISVVVQEDNKAVLYVALDRSDKSYYACDGGCLDDPVLLGPQKKMFPVKLTDPVTAILYITYDKQHMEELRHTIHLKEIVEAPAHEHHVIALHKHGHHLGGLPTLFWVSICFLIVTFHLFLFKLIYNEYCGQQQDKYRTRYGKL